MSNQVEGQSVSPNDAKPDVLRLREVLIQELNKAQKRQRKNKTIAGRAEEQRIINAIHTVMQLIDVPPPVA